jgi:hypothetical protein
MLKAGRCFNSSPRKLFSKQPLREAANEPGMQGKRQLHSAVALPPVQMWCRMNFTAATSPTVSHDSTTDWVFMCLCTTDFWFAVTALNWLKGVGTTLKEKCTIMVHKNMAASLLHSCLDDAACSPASDLLGAPTNCNQQNIFCFIISG